MKKKDQQDTLFNSDIVSKKKDQETDKIKTTNINTLLNRVRIDQKKTLKKRIVF